MCSILRRNVILVHRNFALTKSVALTVRSNAILKSTIYSFLCHDIGSVKTYPTVTDVYIKRYASARFVLHSPAPSFSFFVASYLGIVALFGIFLTSHSRYQRTANKRWETTRSFLLKRSSGMRALACPFRDAFFITTSPARLSAISLRDAMFS